MSDQQSSGEYEDFTEFNDEVSNLYRLIRRINKSSRAPHSSKQHKRRIAMMKTLRRMKALLRDEDYDTLDEMETMTPFLHDVAATIPVEDDITYEKKEEKEGKEEKKAPMSVRFDPVLAANRQFDVHYSRLLNLHEDASRDDIEQSRENLLNAYDKVEDAFAETNQITDDNFESVMGRYIDALDRVGLLDREGGNAEGGADGGAEGDVEWDDDGDMSEPYVPILAGDDDNGKDDADE